eukprot:TRINITY_DN1087_c0_g4_i2.p1 TRINITY_DN1087_c0_g4~~TRINITY_DN1087_c0_g4_i2.p1  ORF type:complete len:488 (-),score=38.64 TRINITY_DN1087_c0_g4_i2:630-2093(-)
MRTSLAIHERANISRRPHSFKANNALVISKGRPLKAQYDRRTESRRVSAQKVSNSNSRWLLLAPCLQSEGREKSDVGGGKEKVQQRMSADIDVVIHVCDDNRKAERNFVCKKSKLLSHMKYFNQFKEEGTELEDLEISVHCDVSIFEWLIEYIQSPSTQKFSMKTSNVVSILISSEYLKMEELMKECIEYFVKHIGEVLRLPINPSCISPEVIRKIAAAVSIGELDRQVERKGNLTSRLYMEKLEMLLEEPGNSISRCVYCNQLFCLSHIDKLRCLRSAPFIDYHGELKSLHIPDNLWSNKRFISYLRQHCNLTWHNIYWTLWARLHLFQCSVCTQYFTPAHVNFCLSHSAPPKFAAGANVGSYPCCEMEAVRFNVEPKISGCVAAGHKVEEKSELKLEVWNKVQEKINVIAEKFNNFAKKDIVEGNGLSHSLQALTESYVDQHREYLEEPCSSSESDFSSTLCPAATHPLIFGSTLKRTASISQQG